MPYVSRNYTDFAGMLVGDGECVAYVKKAANINKSARYGWKPGAKVENTKVEPGTAIAMFIGGQYLSESGSAHAAILDEKTADGIWVYDQWHDEGEKPEKVARRFYRFRDTAGKKYKNASNYYVIE